MRIMKNSTLKPTILIDSREQNPWKINSYPVEVAALETGDYSILGFHNWENPGFAVERKSLPDLIGSLTTGRERFEKEIERLRRFRFAMIIVEADREDVIAGRYRSRATPKSMLASITAFEVRAGIHFCWSGDAERAARDFELYARQFIRGVQKDFARLKRSVRGKPVTACTLTGK